MNHFVSEAIEPLGGFDAAAMSRGEPGLPGGFRWRDHEHRITAVLARWKTCTRDMGELYLRRHWYEVRTDDGHRMTLYCERQARSTRTRKQRWWLYSVSPAA